jgi:hypothetical protein
MNEIGWAVKQMWNGSRVRRAGWDGKGMFLILFDDWVGSRTDISVNEERKDPLYSLEKLPFVAMKTADDKLVPWLCSQTDLLATDWEGAD